MKESQLFNAANNIIEQVFCGFSIDGI
jgi:hypothetical protein